MLCWHCCSARDSAFCADIRNYEVGIRYTPMFSVEIPKFTVVQLRGCNIRIHRGAGQAIGLWFRRNHRGSGLSPKIDS